MKTIAIIGAGYGGLRAAEILIKKSGDKDFSILLIDQNPYHYMQTEVYGYIAGRFELSDIVIDLKRFSRGLGENVTFLQEKVTNIDAKHKTITTEQNQIGYDYAIIAVGAKTNFFSFIEGAKEHTHGIKSLQRAFAFRQAFEQRIAMKLQNSRLKRAGDLHIAIAGAGLSGVEVAAEMAYTLEKYKKILSNEGKNIKISLIDAANSVLPGMHPYLIEVTQKRLEKLGVEILTKRFISQITNRYIKFKDGAKIDFDFVIFTAGIEGASLIEDLDVPKNKINQVLPEKNLEIPNMKDVFVIGDCAQISDKEGNILPPTAQVAEKSAAYVAEVIINREKGESTPPLKTSIDGLFIALGGKYAVGILFDRIKVEGYLAYILKKAITLFYRYGLEIKVNAGYKKRTLQTT